MSITAPKWEAAWHYERKRWYFQDRVTGRSCWSRPLGCTTALPAGPPADYDEAKPPPPESAPAGWDMVYDRTNKRYYYYKLSKPTERTWLRPPPIEGAEIVPAASLRRRKSEGKKTLELLIASMWDAESFKHRLEDAYAAREQILDVLAEVVASNKSLLSGRISIPVPQTRCVTWMDCMHAIEEKHVEDYKYDPKVSLSTGTVAEAATSFAMQDPRRVVCVLNMACGTVPGGGYLQGHSGTEEDLCRRMPALYSSLKKAEQEGHYPFGPATCTDVDRPEKYCDVLFTPKCVLARGKEEEGFPVLLDNRRVTVNLVSAAAPDVKVMEERADHHLLVGSVTSIFVAPVLLDPRTTTFIIGTWGCGRGANDKQLVDTFVKAIGGELQGVNLRLGRLYHEIHFAVQQRGTPGDQRGAAVEGYDLLFRKALREHRIPFTEM